jgi:Serine aminopeptidase, S33
MIRGFLFILAFFNIAASIFGGLGLGWIALHPYSHPLTPSEERKAKAAAQEDSVEFRDVELAMPDGAVLRAWFMRPPDANGDAVILLHGVSDNRMGMYGFGRWLVQNHYMVLIPDARAHGNSAGELATYGLKEADDIHGWVDWIETAEHPRCMFGLGESMGAAQLLQSLPKESRFARLWPNRHLPHFVRRHTRVLAARFTPGLGSGEPSFVPRWISGFFMFAFITD